LVDELRDLLRSVLDEQRRGEIAPAEAKYREIVAARPEQWDAVYLHGTALLQLGRFVVEIEVFQRLEKLRADLPDVQNNLGVAYQALGDGDRAARAYQAAINLRGDFDRAYFNLGRLKEQQGLFAEAEAWYRHAAQLKPADASYRLHLAGSLGKQSKWDETDRVLRDAANADPANLDLRINLAYALIQRERLDEAAEIYRHVLAQRPDYHEVHSNLAFVRERQGRFDEALTAAQRAIELRPDYADAFNNLGMILRSMHRMDEAARAFRSALVRKPDFVLAEFNLGTTLLLAENYAAGWSGYRHHGHLGDAATAVAALPEWDGRPISGKRLLIYADQGFGDAIQFARFLPRCKTQSEARVVFRFQPALGPIFARLAGVDESVPEGAAAAACDFQIPLASLPGLLGVTIETAGIGVPYLRPPEKMRSELAELLGRAPADSSRVGLVWQGNPRQTRDVVRSCPLEKLLPLLKSDRATFFSLQTDELARKQIAELHVGDRLIDVGGSLRDFAETAAALARLDLLITVDTASAHLAGALGRPVWTMLCHTPDWRWHLNRSDSPWYPTMRLFRQPRWGDWDSVVAEIRDCLAYAHPSSVTPLQDRATERDDSQ
jgi:Flp pilus assembly protein TadD